MTEISSSKCTVVESNLASSAGTSLLSAEAVPVVTVGEVPYLTTQAPVDVAVQGSTSQFVNFFQEGSLIGSNVQPSYILTTSEDGSGTILLDASQLALLAQQTFPIYDGTKIFQLATQDVIEPSTVAVVSETSDNLSRTGTDAAICSETNGEKQQNPSLPALSEKRTAAVEDDIHEIQPPIKKGPYKCTQCSKEYPRFEQLQRHQKKHAEDKPNRCDECTAAFNIPSNLVLHKATHCKSEPTCPECKKKFSRVASLKAHIMVHEQEENLTCQDCNEEFSTQYKLDRHMCGSQELVEEVATFSCVKCQKKFVKFSHLKEHMKIHYKLKVSLSHKTYKKNIDRSSFHHKCFTCNKLFKKPSQLIRHVRIHTGERPFICEVCSKAFNQKGALQIHMTKHNKVRPHPCDFCPATFSQRGNLRAHIQRVHIMPEGNDVHKCAECSCIFKKLGSLHAHMRRVHADVFTSMNSEAPEDTDNEEMNLNKQVDEVISQLLDVTNHVNANADETNMQIKKIAYNNKVNADILQQALENSGLASSNEIERSPEVKKDMLSKALVMTVTDQVTGKVNKHFIRKVGNVRWYQCIYCSKEFKKPSDLVRHIRIHTHEKPYKCDMCYRAFAVKSTLTAHLRTHSGVKEFKCEVCNKMFSSQGSLRVHVLLHTGAKPYSCCYCGKNFRTSGHRRSHMLSHQRKNNVKKPRKPSKSYKNNVNVTEITLPEPILITDIGYMQPLAKSKSPLTEFSADRPFQCQTCQRAFKKSSHLKQHLRSHSGEKPYECEQCHRSFVSNGVLKAHMKTHSGVKAHKCDVCGSSFTTRGSLKRHLLIHSDERPFMCPYCQKTFKTTISCRKHMRSHRHELAQGGSSGVTVTVVSEAPSGAEEEAHPTEMVQHLTGEVIDGLEQTVIVSESVPTTSATESILPHSVFEAQEQILPGGIHVQQQQQQVLTSEAFSEQPTLQNEMGQAGIILRQEEIGQKQIAEPGQNYEQTQTAFLSQALDHLSSNYGENQFPVQIDSLELNGQHYVTSSSPTIEHQMNSSLQSHIVSDGSHPSKIIILENNVAPNEKMLENELEGQQRRGRKSYNCLQCSRAFKKSSHLKQHIRTHTGEKPHMCTHCGRMFVSASVLKGHMKTHEGKRDFLCSMCNTGFTTKGSLTRHMATHSTKKLYQCSFCTDAFETKIVYREHMKVCEQESSQQIATAREQEEIRGSEYIKAWMSKRHRVPAIQIPEDQTEELAKQNPEDTDSVSEKVLIASAAEKNRISELKNKNAEQENLPRYPHACKSCSKSFKKPSDLVRHLRIHTGEKPYFCESCNKRFTVKSTLDSHVKTHTGEKNFSCHVCCSNFATKGSLKVHMRLHTGARPFKCPHCDLRFRTSGHRKSHIVSHFKTSVLKRRKPAKKSTSILLNSPLSDCDVQTDVQMNDSIPANVPGSTAEAQILEVPQNSDSIQLQFAPGLVGPSIQIATLDPGILSKLISVDATLLQHLQQHVNVNITINPSFLTGHLNGAPTDVVLTESIGEPFQNQPLGSDMSTSNNLLGGGTIALNPNIVFQQLGVAVSSKTQPEPLLPGNSASNMSYSVVRANPTEITALNDASDGNAVSHAIGQSEDVFMGENVEESSIIVENALVQASQANDMEVLNLCAADVIAQSDDSIALGERSVKSDKQYVCTVCKLAFSKKRHLFSHKLVHKDEKQHQVDAEHLCEYCDAPFAHKRSLLAHVKRVHTISC